MVIFQIGLALDSGYDCFPLVMQIRHVVCQGGEAMKKTAENWLVKN